MLILKYIFSFQYFLEHQGERLMEGERVMEREREAGKEREREEGES